MEHARAIAALTGRIEAGPIFARRSNEIQNQTGREGEMTADITMTIQKAREHSVGDLFVALLRTARSEQDGRDLRRADLVLLRRWTQPAIASAGDCSGSGSARATASRRCRAILHAFGRPCASPIARIGAILAPINFMLNPDEINLHLLANSGAKSLATGPDFVEVAQAATAKGSAIEKLVLAGPAEDPAVAPAGHHHLRRSAGATTPLRSKPSVDSRDPREYAPHERNRVEPQGCDAHARCSAVAVRELRH